MQSTYLPTQPATYSQLIKASLRLYRAGLKGALIISILLTLVMFSPRWWSFLTGQALFFNTALFSLARLGQVALDLVGLVLFSAIFWHYFCVARGLHEPLTEDFSKGIHKVVRVFIAGVIQAAVVFSIIALTVALQYILFNYNLLFGKNIFGLIFTTVFLAAMSMSVFYVSALFIFQAPIIVIENKGIFIALERSMLLVWNHWLRTVCVQVTPWLCYLIVMIILGSVFQIQFHFFFVRQESVTITSTIIQMVLFILLMPWVAALLFTQMKDLELRNHIKP